MIYIVCVLVIAGYRIDNGVKIITIERIQDFIRACNMRGYIVSELNIQNQLEIYNINQEELTFE